MKRTALNAQLGLTIVILGLLSACGSKPKSDEYTGTAAVAGHVYFAADESFAPIMDELVDVFNAQHPGDTVEAIYTNELDAINMLMENKVWVTVATRDLNSKERQNLKERRYLPITKRICYDGLALICHRSNPDSIITVKNLKRILSGEVKQWSELYPGSKLGEIDVCFDSEKSAAVHFCVDSLLDGQPINSPNIAAVKSSPEVINYVEKTPGAIGIIGNNWLNDKRDTTNVTFKKEITVMGVSKMDSAARYNSYKPYQYNLAMGYYPLIRTIYVLVNDPMRALPYRFSNFLTLPVGQLIIFKSSLLPVQGNMEVRNVEIVQ